MKQKFEIELIEPNRNEPKKTKKMKLNRTELQKDKKLIKLDPNRGAKRQKKKVEVEVELIEPKRTANKTESNFSYVFWGFELLLFWLNSNMHRSIYWFDNDVLMDGSSFSRIGELYYAAFVTVTTC